MNNRTEVVPIMRSDIVAALAEPITTKPYYTKYELCSLLAIRSQQLADGAKPLVSIAGLNQSDIRFTEYVAKREIEQQVLPFIIRRQMPDGTSEYISARQTEIIE